MKSADLRKTVDRRKSGRRQAQVVAAFKRMENQETSALMLNFSDRGAYLVSSSPPSKGAVVEVQAGPSKAIGKVTFVRELGDGIGGFGVEFLNAGGRSNPKIASKTEATVTLRPEGLREEAFEYYDRLRRVRDFVTEHLSEDFPLTRAAKIATLEKTYFSTFFHEKVGITYRKWLQYVRVKEAMDQIRSSNCSITEAGLACGFQDLRTFERAFKKWTSMVPREFKKLVTR